MDGYVALRKESVDRNVVVWAVFLGYNVALRKESVDRNFGEPITNISLPGRSPQGERG